MTKEKFSILKSDAEPFDSPIIEDDPWDENFEGYNDDGTKRYNDEYKALCITYMIAHRAGMADGISYAQASRALHVGASTLSRWLKDYKEHGNQVNDNVRQLLDNQVISLDMKLNSLLGASIELLTERVSKGLVETDDLIKLVSATSKTKQGLHESRVNTEIKREQIQAEKESGAKGMQQLVSGLSALGDLKESIQRRIAEEGEIIEGVTIDE